MKRVRIVSQSVRVPYARQLPASFCQDYGYAFLFGFGPDAPGAPAGILPPPPGEEGGEDYLVCYDELQWPLETRIPREHRILFIGEPPCITRYPAEYLQMFGTVVCPYELPKYRGRQVKSHASLWWFYGIDMADPERKRFLTWEELAAAPEPVKTGELSTVCGNKSWCRMHRRRRDFVRGMQRRLGTRMTSFGPGFAPAPDKKDAIDPYKYHIVVENNDERGFWTEKLADAFLGWSFPFYFGGADVEKDFPAGSLQRIDVDRPRRAVAVMEDCMRRGLWEERLPLIREARNRILREHNFFYRIRALIDGLPPAAPLPAPERLPSFNEIRLPYHFREHLNHQAFRHLPIKKPLFPL